MIPGEYLLDGPPIELNVGRPTCPVEVTNTGDRPIQVGAHFHFFEVNRALVFDREAAYGMRLDLPAGTAVRFEPGEVKRVQLVALGGQRRVFGGNALVSGPLDDARTARRASNACGPRDSAIRRSHPSRLSARSPLRNHRSHRDKNPG